ncbi:hypothetical protein MTO96_039204 [Rhipicephalus appendiculatus]
MCGYLLLLLLLSPIDPLTETPIRPTTPPPQEMERKSSVEPQTPQQICSPPPLPSSSTASTRAPSPTLQPLLPHSSPPSGPHLDTTAADSSTVPLRRSARARRQPNWFKHSDYK